jgi:hypothetical protein
MATNKRKRPSLTAAYTAQAEADGVSRIRSRGKGAMEQVIAAHRQAGVPVPASLRQGKKRKK